MEDFKLLNKSKMLLKYMESNILVNIPKVHSSYRKGLEDNVIELNYNIINKKKFMIVIRMLNEIRKMTNSWILSEKN